MARLLRARGIKGELVAESLTSHPERLEALERVTLEKGTKRAEFEVARVWFHGDRPVFQFQGISSMTDAEPWAGAEVLIDEADRLPLPEGEYYFSDLIGCTAVRFDSGEPIGVVEDVEEYPAGATLVVRSGKREMLIPLAGAICREVDLVARVIRVDPPEGLLELADV
ncbi:MAG: ribosome maturation factor RimM [Bryobacteraceae bacterium]